MTWPWVLNLRNAVSDRGDPYAIVYWLWWGSHQTFTDPANLFQATVFYPYQYTMAFTENNYGVSLLFSPLYALGFRPMTVHSVATFMAFAFAGYGMFRLARTLSGSTGVAWIAGLVFAFIPYRFQRLPHLHLIFTGWIPLLLESVVLFARQRSWRRAGWIAVTFTMNALTAITWFILVLVPLALSVAFVVAWYKRGRDLRFWVRSGLAALLAAVVLLPFLLPYYYVHKLYGFVRSPEDVSRLSAYPIHWLAASERNKLWAGMGGKAAIDEFTLFPGFLPLFLTLAAVFLVKPLSGGGRRLQSVFEKLKVRLATKHVVVALDVLALALLLIVLLSIGYGGIHFRIAGYEVFRSNHLFRPLLYCLVVIILRLMIAVPEVLQRILPPKSLTKSLRDNSATVLLVIAAIWGLTGFLGSFGMHLFFHRTLYRYVPLFTSMRAPVRWAMICYVGLALCAGFGAYQLVQLIRRWVPRLPRALPYLGIALLILFEQRVAPIQFVRGEVDPDAVSVRLSNTPMTGGIVQLPAERDNYAYYRYMLRAADHGRPLVTASASFAPPILHEIEGLTAARPIPDTFLDLLERIPVSYLVVHNGLLKPESRNAVESFVEFGLTSGRLRFVNSYGDPSNTDDLYAVTKTEPAAKSEAARPKRITFVRRQYFDILAREPGRAETEKWDKKVEYAATTFRAFSTYGFSKIPTCCTRASFAKPEGLSTSSIGPSGAHRLMRNGSANACR
jgi:hypothetical protein